MFDSAIARTRETIRPAPSSLTASAPPSFTSLIALATACSSETSYEPNGRSPTTSGRRAEHVTGPVGVARRERAGNRERPLALGGREAGVPGRERETVGTADGLDGADLDTKVEVAYDLPDHGELLRVLAPEVRRIGPDDVEE